MKEFGELLLDRKLLTAPDLMRAEGVHAKAGGRLPAILTKLGLVPETDLAKALSDIADLPLLREEDFPKELPALDGLNPRFLRKRGVLPLAINGSCLTLAMGDPGDEEAKRALAFAAGIREVVPVVASFSDIARGLDKCLPTDDDFGDTFTDGSADDVEWVLEGESEAPIIRLVQRLLVAAVERRASDVHIEPMGRYLSIRYRIDGRLVEVERQGHDLAVPVASRIKVMSGLDIAESRLPQDGRLKVTAGGRDVDVRVSTSPIAHGESIVLRLLGRSEIPLDLERLGLPALALAKFCRVLDRPHGMILLTGPTGSGKTTTLYAAVSRLRRPEVKILTVEDPVEILLEGVNQVQVKPEINLSYAATLRAFLRQDPDIIMVGEIRDQETAEIALRASLTGHLVLSTLHTNSALGAFTRLADIGIEPFLTASTVIATIAQRLVRCICLDCAGHREVTEAEAVIFSHAGLPPPEMVPVAVGCATCLGTGYRGRTPLIEVIEVDDVVRRHIRDGSTETLEEERLPDETLFAHGLALVAERRSTLDELYRVVQSK